MLVREIEIKYSVRGEVEGRAQGPADVAAAIRRIVGDDPREHFCVVYLDTRNGIADVEIISVGTINQSLVHPREVFRTAIAKSAVSIAVAHQHPSGDPTPSREDHAVTRRLAEAGHLLGITLIDHVVVGSEGRWVSLREDQPNLFLV